MKAISLWQPWATLIAIGEKRIETRGWPTRYRGTILIHAAKTWRGWNDLLYLTSRTIAQMEVTPGSVPYGAFVAVADLVDCMPADDALESLGEEAPRHERAFGWYGPGRHGWILDNVTRLKEPIPARGQQGLWTPDAKTQELVEVDEAVSLKDWMAQQ